MTPLGQRDLFDGNSGVRIWRVARWNATSAARGDMATKKSRPETDKSVSQQIDARIKEFDDWRGETLARLRTLIQQADPGVVEEWKWGIPVWSHYGLICTGEVYKSVVKTTFARGAALDDPAGLFNSSLGGALRRAIDFHQGEEINARAFKTLVRAAVALNKSKASGSG
jgi:hypothetical protein